MDETLKRMRSVLMPATPSANHDELASLRQERDALRHRVLVLQFEVSARNAANQILRNEGDW